jgi:hypothetical protein
MKVTFGIRVVGKKSVVYSIDPALTSKITPKTGEVLARISRVSDSQAVPRGGRNFLYDPFGLT